MTLCICLPTKLLLTKPTYFSMQSFAFWTSPPLHTESRLSLRMCVCVFTCFCGSYEWRSPHVESVSLASAALKMGKMGLIDLNTQGEMTIEGFYSILEKEKVQRIWRQSSTENSKEGGVDWNPWVKWRMHTKRVLGRVWERELRDCGWVGCDEVISSQTKEEWCGSEGWVFVLPGSAVGPPHILYVCVFIIG